MSEELTLVETDMMIEYLDENTEIDSDMLLEIIPYKSMDSPKEFVIIIYPSSMYISPDESGDYEDEDPEELAKRVESFEKGEVYNYIILDRSNMEWVAESHDYFDLEYIKQVAKENADQH